MERDSLIYVWRALLSKLVILNKEAPHIYSPRPNATQRTGRIQERKKLPRTHIHPTTDSRSIPVQWKTPCYVNFIDFENAFNSIHRESLWCILRHYGIPCKIVTIIKMLYEGFKTKMIYGQHVTEEFHKPGRESDKIWKHRGWNQDKDLQGKVSICGSEEHLEDENDQQENKDTHFQEERPERTATWVVYRQGRITPFRMPIYPMLHQRNANPMTPNPGLWLVESVMNIDENPFRMPIYPMLKLWILMSWIFRSTSSHALCVLGQARPSDLNVVNPLSYWPPSSDHISTNTVVDGAWCFDRPSQGGAWYTPTCPVVTVRSTNVKSFEYWWAEYFVLGQATPSWPRLYSWPLLTTYPLTQSLVGACCFDRPPQGGAWYTCPVVIVRSSLDVYKPWWDRAGEIVVWGQICSCGVCCEIYF